MNTKKQLGQKTGTMKTTSLFLFIFFIALFIGGFVIVYELLILKGEVFSITFGYKISSIPMLLASAICMILSLLYIFFTLKNIKGIELYENGLMVKNKTFLYNMMNPITIADENMIVVTISDAENKVVLKALSLSLKKREILYNLHISSEENKKTS